MSICLFFPGIKNARTRPNVELRALTQRYGLARPMPTRRLVSGHSNHQGSFPTSSGWTEPIFYGRVRCNRSRRFVRLQRDVRTGSPASTQSKRRLHFRNTTVRLSKGPQMHGSDRRPRARVLDPRSVCLHLRSERQQDQHLSLRLDANRDAVEMKRRGSFLSKLRGFA